LAEKHVHDTFQSERAGPGKSEKLSSGITSVIKPAAAVTVWDDMMADEIKASNNNMSPSFLLSE
jgi:hypothetical protein